MRVRKVESLESLRKRFYRLESQPFFEAVMGWLAFELRKPIRAQDWVAMAVLRQVAFDRGLWHQFEKAWDYVWVQIESEETPLSLSRAFEIDQRRSDSLKERVDRSREYHKMMILKKRNQMKGRK